MDLQEEKKVLPPWLWLLLMNRPNITYTQIQEGVSLYTCKTNKFKSALMNLSFAVPLDAETASCYSLLTNLLSLSTADYPDMQTFSIVKDELYALGLDAFVQRRGEILLITLEINTIADSFAFDNEQVLLKATRLLSSAIFRPNLVNGVFPHETVESEKLCLIEEIASAIENKPSFALKRAREILCKGEPFAVDAGGEIERVESLSGADLAKAHKFILENAPVFITYSGEADSKYVEECIRMHLPFSPRAKVLPQPVFHKKADDITRITEQMDMEQSVLILGFASKMPQGPRDRAILSVYDEILGGSSSSKLFMNVREKEGLCYYCSSYPSGRKNVIFISCGLEPGNEDVAIDAIYRQIDAMKQGDFSDSELANAKNAIIRSIQSLGGSLGGLNGYMLGQALLPDSVSLDKNAEFINSVTRQDVVDFANSVFPQLEYILTAEDFDE